jgi:hypothetical protein
MPEYLYFNSCHFFCNVAHGAGLVKLRLPYARSLESVCRSVWILHLGTETTDKEKKSEPQRSNKEAREKKKKKKKEQWK